MNKRGGSGTDGRLAPGGQRQIPTKRNPERETETRQPRRPSSQGGEATGWAERQARVAEQHVGRPRSAAERTAVERGAAERAWLVRERAQGRNKKAAYARWREGRKAWLRREERKAARKRKKPRGCNVRMEGAAMAEEQTLALKDAVAGGGSSASEDTVAGGGPSESEPTAKAQTEAAST